MEPRINGAMGGTAMSWRMFTVVLLGSTCALYLWSQRAVLHKAALQQTGSDLGSLVAGSAVTTSTVRAVLGGPNRMPLSMLKVAKYVATQLGQISRFYLDYHFTAVQSALHGDWTLASFGLMAVWSGLCGLLAFFFALAYISPLHSAVESTTQHAAEAKRSQAALDSKLSTNSHDAAVLQQRMDSVEGLMKTGTAVLKQLHRKLRREKSAKNLQLSTFVRSRLRVQKVQQQQLQKQKQQCAKLARSVRMLAGKAARHRSQVAKQNRRAEQIQDASAENTARQAAVIADLQHSVKNLTNCVDVQSQQFQHTTAAQAEQIQQLQHEVANASDIQNELQTLRSVLNFQQDQNGKVVQELRVQLDAASGQQAELDRRQTEAEAGLKSQVKLAHRATEDLASQVKVLFDSDLASGAMPVEAGSMASASARVNGGVPTETAQAATAAPEPLSQPKFGGASDAKVQKGRIYKMAARFGALAPSKSLALLRKSSSTGSTFRKLEEEEQAPPLARASRSSIPKHQDTAQPSSEVESLQDATDSAPPTADYSTAVNSFNKTAMPAGAGVERSMGVDAVVTAAPMLEASRANSKADLMPSFASSSPLLPADAYSSFQDPMDAEIGKEGKGRGLLRRLSSSNRGQKVQGLIKSFRKKS